MKKGWAAGEPEFGKLIVPSVAYWPEAGDATSQQTKLSSNDAPAERRRVNTGAPQALNRDVMLTLAIQTSSWCNDTQKALSSRTDHGSLSGRQRRHRKTISRSAIDYSQRKAMIGSAFMAF